VHHLYIVRNLHISPCAGSGRTDERGFKLLHNTLLLSLARLFCCFQCIKHEGNEKENKSQFVLFFKIIDELHLREPLRVPFIRNSALPIFAKTLQQSRCELFVLSYCSSSLTFCLCGRLNVNRN